MDSLMTINLLLYKRSNMDGYNAELELEDRFWELGGVALRSPGSGGATTKARPDVIGYYNGQWHCFELKATSKDYANFAIGDLKLKNFCKVVGITPYAAARFSYDKTIYLHDMRKERTSFSIKRNDANNYLTLKKLLEG